MLRSIRKNYDPIQIKNVAQPQEKSVGSMYTRYQSQHLDAKHVNGKQILLENTR